MKKISTLKFLAPLLLIYLRIPTLYAQTWVEANNGTIGGYISTLITVNDKIYASSSSNGVFVTNNDQIHWSALNGGLGSSFINSVYSYDGNLYAASYGDGVFVSGNGGNNWAQSDSGFLQSAIYANAFASLDTFLFVGVNDGGYYSTDSGLHWNPMPYLFTQTVYSYAVDNGVMYAGSTYGMHISLDSGATWAYINNGLPEEIIWNIVVSGNRVLCNVNGNQIYASTDSGANWVASSSGIPANANVKSLFADGNTVYAGTDSYGIYRSIDNGATWSDYSFGNDFSQVTAICESNGKIIVGTSLEGIFRLENANGVSDISTSSLHLYPNPAADEIFIQDELNGIKEIKIVDGVGRCVMATSLDGITSKKISVENLAPGIYTAIVNGSAVRFEKY